MKKRRRHGILTAVLLPVAAVVVLLCFLGGINDISRGSVEEGRKQLEDVVRRSAVACYAAEGIYPPNVEYLEEHYGVVIDHDRYHVSYVAIADNLMPDITVLEK